MSTRLSRSLIGLFLLAAVGFLVLGSSPRAPQAAGNWQVTAANWSSTGKEDPEPVPAVGSVLERGQRIATARGQSTELYVGGNRIALRPNTIIIVGDDDPGTEIDTFELVSGRIDLTVYKDEFATIDAPGLKATSHGADFHISTFDTDTKIAVTHGLVTVLATATGTSSELGADTLATIAPEGISQQSLAEAQKAIAAATAEQAWVMKEIRVVSEDPAHPFDMTKLPKSGDALAVGTQISTMSEGNTKVQVDLVRANGSDAVRVEPNSVVTVGDANPKSERPDIAILAGAMLIKTSGHSLFVYAPHLTATFEDSSGSVRVQPTASAVSVISGTVHVASIWTGESRDVPFGATQIVRAANTPPVSIPENSTTIFQMQ